MHWLLFVFICEKSKNDRIYKNLPFFGGDEGARAHDLSDVNRTL